MKVKSSAPIPVTHFRTHCFAILETVRRKGTTVIISKHGVPIAKLVPIETDSFPSLYGSMKGTAREIGDIVSPLEEEWDAARDE